MSKKMVPKWGNVRVLSSLIKECKRELPKTSYRNVAHMVDQALRNELREIRGDDHEHQGASSQVSP